MCALPRLRLIFTGGTISMEDDLTKSVIDKGGHTRRYVVPTLSSKDILGSVVGLEKICLAEGYDYGRIPSPHMTPDRMFELAHLVKDSFAQGFDGVVMTHGTDTMEETAFLLDLFQSDPRPVVLVGAMRNRKELSWDGPINLYQACQVAASPLSRGRGVIVVMNGKLDAASEVTKTFTEAIDSFQCPDTGPLGMIDNDEVIYYRGPVVRRQVPMQALEPKVSLLVAAAGSDGRLIDFLIAEREKAIVIEGLGRGNLPPAMADAACRAVKEGILVVLTSRCWGGRVVPSYAYAGGGRQLADSGVLFATGLQGHKARLLVMAALGAGLSREQIAEILSPPYRAG